MVHQCHVCSLIVQHKRRLILQRQHLDIVVIGVLAAAQDRFVHLKAGTAEYFVIVKSLLLVAIDIARSVRMLRLCAIGKLLVLCTRSSQIYRLLFWVVFSKKVVVVLEHHIDWHSPGVEVEHSIPKANNQISVTCCLNMRSFREE